MPVTPPSLAHVYDREVSAAETTSLNLLAAHITLHSKVLDLGCGTGALGRWLSSHVHCTIDGVTLNEVEAAHARSSYRKVVVGDLETLALSHHFEIGAYDFIVCADVLEHLTNPASLLDTCRPLLSPHGKLLVSVPNAAYCGLIAELMQGNFEYRDEGLLDRTHLRFFTRKTLTEFLTANNWFIDSLETVQRDLPDSEFKTPFDSLPPAVSRYLLATPDALTYQFILSSQPKESIATEVSALQPALTESPATLPGKAWFCAELFFQTASGFDQSQKLSARGEIGRPHQTLRFELRPTPEPITRLRLDPADRPGFLHLHALRLMSTAGELLWDWRPVNPHGHGAATPGEMPRHQIQWHQPGFPSASPLLILFGDDPWFELPISPATLKAASTTGAVLEVDAGWPLSADYLMASNEIQLLNKEVETYRQAVEHKDSQTNALTHQLEQLNSDRLRLDEQVTSLLAERDHLTAMQQSLLHANSQTQQELDRLADHLRWIENSTVFRLTRPLVHSKMALQRILARARKPTDSVTQAPSRPMKPTVHPVDVIVPVYKGLDDTRRCILSVLQGNCLSPFRLVVINDSSPEPEVTAWLREVASSDNRIVLLENPENLGFVGTVNRGMEFSADRDVILLNSDAEVANDWLDRLIATAYSDQRIGTVTPFSNNATICSYPRFCAANPLVTDHTTASLDALCAQLHPGASVEIPTGVGFCMYIRRDCLEAVGLFDMANFGKGYGEENDFCHRAHKAGWKNLHALDTFVLHAGGISFGDSKGARELAAMETLRRLHPHYEAEVMRFIQADPAQPYRHALDLARLAQSVHPKVLAITHDRAGGTLRHVKELAQTLQGRAHFFMLTPAPGGRAALELLGEYEGFKLEFNMETGVDDLVLLLRSVGICLVHFHHLLGHHPRVQALPELLGVPFDFTAHDHYTYCPQISLTNATNRYCGEAGLAQCHSCLQHSPAPGGVDINTWRSNHQRFLRGTRFILTPSQDITQRMQRFMPGATVQLAPHTDVSGTLPATKPPTRQAGAPLKVVVIGALSTIKGADLLEDVAILAGKNKAPIDFHLVGYAYRSLKTRPRSHLTVHGEYTEAELPGMLEWLQPDVVWFPALWPETYSYTLSACLQAGLPVVAPNLGAFPERLAQRAWSWIQPWDTPATDWLAFFQHIHTAHFSTGVPPAVPAGPDLPKPARIWDYTQHYLPPALGAHAPSLPAPAVAWLHAHRPGQALPGLQGLHTGLRRRALSGLLRLRSAPGLRGLAQAIPLRWQTRIKSWLVR